MAGAGRRCPTDEGRGSRRPTRLACLRSHAVVRTPAEERGHPLRDRSQAKKGWPFRGSRPPLEGPARSQAALGHGSHDRCSAREPARRDHGSVAGRDAGTQAEDAGRGGARQQDGTEGLGTGNEKGDLPGSRCRLSWRRKERSESKEAARRCGQQDARNGVRANGRQDGVGKTSESRRAYEPGLPIWIRSHEHHTGPRPQRAASRGRTYDST